VPNLPLRERVFRDQKALMERCNTLVMVRPYMDDMGIDRKCLRALDTEIKRLGLLIKALGWASCCIPSNPPAGE